MLENLKEEVLEANLDLVRHGLVIFTWGNVSAIDRASGRVVIKPSGVEYEALKAEDMVVVDLDGNVVEGSLRPSSDTPTHLALYRAFEGIGGVVHTHSTYATAWAQAGLDIPSLGTTHADYFHRAVPCTGDMTHAQIDGDYEAETGAVIVERFRSLDPLHTPGVLVKNHGPFAWGRDAHEAVYNATVLEQVAKMAFITKLLNPTAGIDPLLVEKHFRRKHGPDAYYGQKRTISLSRAQSRTQFELCRGEKRNTKVNFSPLLRTAPVFGAVRFFFAHSEEGLLRTKWPPPRTLRR